MTRAKGTPRTSLYALLFFGVLSISLGRAALAARPCSTCESSFSNEDGEQIKTAPLTATDTIVLADFDNITGEAVFDGMLEEALAIEVEQSPYLNILSERRVEETLTAMGRPSNQGIAPDVGRDICLRTGSQAVLGGTVSRLQGHYLVTLTASACSSGEILAKEQGEATNTKDVLRALSRACAVLRSKLGESLSSVESFDVPIDVATSSLDALRNYSIAIAVRREQGDTPSIPFFRRAVEIDPNFPMAYAELASIYGNLRQPSLRLQYATKGYALRKRANEREKLRITGIYFLATGDLGNEIRNYELWEARYPRDFMPFNNLGNDYAATGNLDMALSEYQRALQIMPSVISYTNVAGMYLTLNRLDAAEAALEEAFRRKLDGRYLHQTLYWIAFLRGDVEQMEQQVTWAAGKPRDEDVLLSMQSDTEAYHGRLVKAQELTRQAVQSAVRAESKETAALWEVNAALREAELGDIVAARQGVASALALSSGRDVTIMGAFTLARAGDSARAKSLINALERNNPTDTLMKLYWLPTINAAIELSQGNYSQALEDLRAAEPYELGGAGTFINYLYPAYLRGQLYLLTHRGDAAISELKKMLEHSGIVLNFVTGALTHLQIGRAYAMIGDAAEARAAYKAFLMLWKDADPEFSVRKEADREYARLSQ